MSFPASVENITDSLGSLELMVIVSVLEPCESSSVWASNIMRNNIVLCSLVTQSYLCLLCREGKLLGALAVGPATFPR